jgi:hypothetical protein
MRLLPRPRLTVFISVGPLLGICLAENKNARVPFFGSELFTSCLKPSINANRGMIHSQWDRGFCQE